MVIWFQMNVVTRNDSSHRICWDDTYRLIVLTLDFSYEKHDFREQKQKKEGCNIGFLGCMNISTAMECIISEETLKVYCILPLSKK